MLPVIIAGGVILAVGTIAYLIWKFTQGPTQENSTMNDMEEKLRAEEKLAEEKRKNEERAKKIAEEKRKNEERARRIAEEKRKNKEEARKVAAEREKLAAELRKMEEMFAEREREQERRRKLRDTTSQQLADEQKKRNLQDQHRQAVEDAKRRNEERLRKEEERIAAAIQKNEEEKLRLREEREMVKERERSLEHNFAKMQQMLEQERAAREKAENGIQPEVWPTRGELEQAKENVQYSRENYHFAIAGKAGSGKSSIINAFLNLGSNDEGAARTGTTETTLEIGRFPDPGKQPPRSRTVWFDVPGAGTQNFSSWQYFNKLGLYVFDLIIVAIGDRFEETDIQILQNCRQFGIPYFIVRSKADQHILNSMKEFDSKIYRPDDNKTLYWKCRKSFINDTKRTVKEGLAKANLPDQKVYIISRDILRETYNGSLNTLDYKAYGTALNTLDYTTCRNALNNLDYTTCKNALKDLTKVREDIHEAKLVEALLRAAVKRRCGTLGVEQSTSDQVNQEAVEGQRGIEETEQPTSDQAKQGAAERWRGAEETEESTSYQAKQGTVERWYSAEETEEQTSGRVNAQSTAFTRISSNKNHWTASDTNTVEAKQKQHKGQQKWQNIDSTWEKRVLYPPYPTNAYMLRRELRAQNPALPAKFPASPNMYSPKVAVLYFHPTVDIPSEVTVFGETVQLVPHKEKGSSYPKNSTVGRNFRKAKT